ncbi:MAG: gamma-glutamylcyclotransferase family protein [Candidatus Heimdallarchaeota archaeon]
MLDEGNNSEQCLLAVYGTLKENFPNYFYYLNPRKPIFRGLVQIPYKMYSNGNFPLLFPAEEDHPIHLEIFEVEEKVIMKIDNLEGVPHLYHRVKIYFEEVKAEVFLYVVANREPTGELIEDGIFKPKD